MAGSKLTRVAHDRLIAERFDPKARVVLYRGDRLELLRQIPDGSASLIVTSPPYNIGKTYERHQLPLGDYLDEQARTIAACVRVLREGGSLCWQVSNYVRRGEIFPLDTLLYAFFKAHGLKLRNRVVWHYEHGLNSQKRFSGRYETIMWFTRGDDYRFRLDPVRVPQKYPGKLAYKGPKRGRPSGNPLGKNPGDVWIIPNVKHNHPEKTIHPCQFPVELVERLILALTDEGDLVVDPYLGVGSSAVASVIHGRRVAGSDIERRYITIARRRVLEAAEGRLRIRPMGQPVFVPRPGKLTRNPFREQKSGEVVS